MPQAVTDVGLEAPLVAGADATVFPYTVPPPKHSVNVQIHGDSALRFAALLVYGESTPSTLEANSAIRSPPRPFVEPPGRCLLPTCHVPDAFLAEPPRTFGFSNSLSQKDRFPKLGSIFDNAYLSFVRARLLGEGVTEGLLPAS